MLLQLHCFAVCIDKVESSSGIRRQIAGAKDHTTVFYNLGIKMFIVSLHQTSPQYIEAASGVSLHDNAEEYFKRRL